MFFKASIVLYCDTAIRTFLATGSKFTLYDTEGMTGNSPTGKEIWV